MMKMRALSRYFDNRPIHAYINEGPDHATIGYLQMCPLVAKAFVDKNAPFGYNFPPEVNMLGKTDPADTGSRHHKWWALLKNSVNYGGYDVWAVLNPCIDEGMEFKDIWPELEPYGGTEYEPPLKIPAAAKAYVRQFGEKPLLFYPSGISANRLFHGNHWTKEDWALTAQELYKQTKKPLVIIGANTKNDLGYWSDGHDSLKSYLNKMRVKYIDSIGKTNVQQYCALISNAAAWVGMNSGGGFVSAMLKVPTVMLWSDSRYPLEGSNSHNMHTPMQRSWLNETQLQTYRTLSYGSPQLTPENVAKKTLEVIR